MNVEHYRTLLQNEERRLLGQRPVERFVLPVDDDLCRGHPPLQSRHAPDVIQMRVRQRDGLQLKPPALNRLGDAFRLVARIDADAPLRFLAAEDARVLLKGGDGHLLDNHSCVACPFPKGYNDV